jgi:hypothetical protein
MYGKGVIIKRHESSVSFNGRMTTLQDAVLMEIGFRLHYLIPVSEELFRAMEFIVAEPFVTLNAFAEIMMEFEERQNVLLDKFRNLIAGFLGIENLFLLPFEEDGWESFVGHEAQVVFEDLEYYEAVKEMGKAVHRLDLALLQIKAWQNERVTEQFVVTEGLETVMFVGWSENEVRKLRDSVYKQAGDVLEFKEIIGPYVRLAEKNNNGWIEGLRKERTTVLEDTINTIARSTMWDFRESMEFGDGKDPRNFIGNMFCTWPYGDLNVSLERSFAYGTEELDRITEDLMELARK